MKLIDKDIIVTEIERRLNANGSFDEFGDETWFEESCWMAAYKSILSFIDTLEMREVDLDREIRRYRMRNPIIQHKEGSLYDYMANVAKHFFKLGLNARKKESKEVASTNINNSNVHLMSELPQTITQKLFELRGVPAQQELTTYNLIVVDDDIYYTPDEYGKKMLKEYFERKDSFHAAAIPHAIIKNGYVVKNRYGYVNIN